MKHCNPFCPAVNSEIDFANSEIDFANREIVAAGWDWTESDLMGNHL